MVLTKIIRMPMTLFKKLTVSLAVASACLSSQVFSQPATDFFNPNRSVARNWNEALLFAIRNDFARPTVHARNLFHSSALMYDIWATLNSEADPFFLGNEVNGFQCPFDVELKNTLLSSTQDLGSATDLAISYGMYRLLSHRFVNSPGVSRSQTEFVQLAQDYGVDINFESMDIENDGAAALGNYVADCIINFGLQDGSNEAADYANSFYEPRNEPLDPTLPGNPELQEPDYWQPLKLDIFIDQAGNETDTPPFLGAEWGQVTPFALTEENLNVYERDGRSFWVYHDPGEPAFIGGDSALPAEYQWGHAMVALWSSHLDPTDSIMWDISPASIGNSGELPTTIEGLRDFYNELDGGSSRNGHAVNPATGLPYEPQMVPRGDYTRVLAEFWADGPDSETPPGHWFSILNDAVSDHPDFPRQMQGQGDALSPLEWDVKAYFTLGGALHDAAVSAWGIKGWYDYIRPVSAIRYMADQGQSSDQDADNYSEFGIPLTTGLVELVTEGDSLAGMDNEHVGKIKVYAWRGPDFIADPETDIAGVGWILAENWWPYQRPSFVTPPFAGYVSGHSTFSRAAAEVLTALTGNEYFPGGMAEFVAQQNEFLVFEQGPSVDIRLQWATYRDASDQTSLSRIWGGIHPPVDDIPGRLIGITVADAAVTKALTYFDGSAIPDPEPEPPAPPTTPEPTPTTPVDSGSSGGSMGYWIMGLVLLVAGRHLRRRPG